MTDDVLLIDYKMKQHFDVESVAGNVVIAAMCTCWAHLKLWEVMKPLGECILYHDTDSIIFSAKEGEYIPPLGPYLGQFTNELECAEVGCSGCEIGH